MTPVTGRARASAREFELIHLYGNRRAVIHANSRLMSLSTPYRMFWSVWTLATAFLALRAPGMAALAAGGAAYAALLLWVTARVLPAPPPAPDDEVLRDPPLPFDGLRRSRLAVSLATLVFVTVLGFAFAGRSSRGVFVPGLTPLVESLQRMHTPLGNGYVPVLNLVCLAIIPGALLLLLGASRLTLGLGPWRSGSTRTLALCLLLPIGMSVVALVRGGVTPFALAMMYVHNMLSNGFSEEFFARVVLLSQLRGWLTNESSLATQAMLFALIHFGGSLSDDPSRLVVLATSIALNAPMGLTLGVMAVRSRSVALPSLVHASLDTMGSLLGAR